MFKKFHIVCSGSCHYLYIFSTFSVLTIIQGAPVTNAGEAAEHLIQYEYLEEPDPGANTDISAFVEALKKYQATGNISQTGELDEPTLTLMNTPRCGLSDKTDTSSSGRSKRYSLSTKWDRKHLTWNILQYTNDVLDSQLDDAIETALKYWSDVSGLTFERKYIQDPDIVVLFAEPYVDHGDGIVFQGQVLAHAFYPGSGELSGDAHFDNSETWTVGSTTGTDIVSVATHEFGHSIGLAHSNLFNSIMWPWNKAYNAHLELDQDDINGVQELYGDFESVYFENCVESFTVGTDPGVATANVSWVEPVAMYTNGLSGTVPVQNYYPNQIYNISTYTVVYIAYDSYYSNQNVTCEFVFTVEDREKPIVISCPVDFILSTDDGEPDRVTYWIVPSATDNTGSVSISQSHTLGSALDVGNTTVTYNFTDFSGNVAFCEFIVTIIDIEPPEPVTCPGNSTYSTDMGVNTKTSVTWKPIVFVDNVPGIFAGKRNSIHPSGNTFPLGITEVIYQATDLAMNTGYCSFFVTIIDTEDPVVTCPSDIITNSTEGAITAIVAYTATSTDNVGVTSEKFDIPSGSIFRLGETMVTFTASDSSGNKETCSFTVTIKGPMCTKQCNNGRTCMVKNGIEACQYLSDFNGATESNKASPNLLEISIGLFFSGIAIGVLVATGVALKYKKSTKAHMETGQLDGYMTTTQPGGIDNSPPHTYATIQ